ncbi:MAG: KEOPS complex subunit Pcc1 [Methanobrevibacter boviskoreani]|jgi:hypothetical protein|uniref:KEOPS complex subunit Pcc1 n=1 Tax=Methanobrevibacter boviskoreani TaxID=1348249 RepID=UPI0023A8EC2C|nr:KEOPS complex subunit Pcc1 [Methanobrevibacter boviskoreani]MCI6931065.1 hypothetical protein [Methanobrevibacter boviskoreani]
MEINSQLTIKYTDKESAKISFESLKVDNEGFVKSKLNDDTVEFEINSDSLGSFLNTSDDLIASEIVVEKIINTSKKD